MDAVDGEYGRGCGRLECGEEEDEEREGMEKTVFNATVGLAQGIERNLRSFRVSERGSGVILDGGGSVAMSVRRTFISRRHV